MTSQEWTTLLHSEKEKRRRALEKAYVDEHRLQHVLKADQLNDLHSHVREWLMSDWDPIGVAGVPEAFDEYQAYERQVVERLMKGCEESLSLYLNDVETGSMGLTRNDQSGRQAARKLFARYREWLETLEK